MDHNVRVAEIEPALAGAEPVATSGGFAVDVPRPATRLARGELSTPFVGATDLVLLLAAASVNVVSPGTALVFAAVCFGALDGTRTPSLHPSAFAEVPALVGRMVAAALVCIPVAVVFGQFGIYAAQVAVSVSVVLVGRAGVYAVVRELRRRGRVARATFVVGEGPTTTRTVELLAEHAELGLDVTDVTPPSEDVVVPEHADVILVAEADGMAGRQVRSLAEGHLPVYVTLGARSLLPPSRRDRLEQAVGEQFVRLAPAAQGRAGWRSKRAFDVTVAFLGLLLLSPIFLVAAVGTKLSSRGPVFFRQARVGRGERIFTMYKFRTYPVDHVDDKFSREHDECPIAFGRFLRRTSIDELPQLFNVLRGEMSIVGPRPERPHFAEPLAGVVREYPLRHRVPGGITGAAQVDGFWGNSCIETRVQIDNRYIDDWSFWSDFGILARTPRAMVRKAGS